MSRRNAYSDDDYDSYYDYKGTNSRRKLYHDSYYDSRPEDSKFNSARDYDDAYDSERGRSYRSKERDYYDSQYSRRSRKRSRSRTPRDRRKSRSRSRGPKDDDEYRSRRKSRSRSRSRSRGPKDDDKYTSRSKSRGRSRGPENRRSRIKESEYKENGLMSSRIGGIGLPPPKANLEHINTDKTLGGDTYTPSGAPFSSFAKETKLTPRSRTRKRVIPWDNKTKDFVYGAIHSEVLLGRMGRRGIKKEMDKIKNQVPWSPDGSITIFLIIALVILILGLLLGIFLAILLWDEFKQYWYVWLLIGLIIIILAAVILFIGIMKINSNIKKREVAIFEKCQKLNAMLLKGSGAKINPGPKAAYLSVDLDDRAFKGSSNSRRSMYDEEPNVSIVKEKVVKDKDGRIIERRKVVDRRPELSGNSTISQSNIGKSSMKQQRFFDRLEGHKKNKEYLHESRLDAPPIQKNREVMKVHYDSEVPEQRTYFDPNKSMNLMG